MGVDFYSELKRSMTETARRRSRQSKEENEREAEELMLICDQLLEFFEIGRKEGLLALEENAEKLDEKAHVWNIYFKKLLDLILCGTDPEWVEEFGTICVWNEPDEQLKLPMLIILRGMHGIQMGEPVYYQEKLLASMLPPDVSEVYLERKEKEKEEKERNTVQEQIEEIGSQQRERTVKDPEYFVMGLFETIIMQMDDVSIRFWLSQVDNADVELALKLTGGAAAKRILENLSKRLAGMILEDMYFMGPVRVRDCVASVKKMFEILLRQMNAGEIHESGAELIQALLDLFSSADKLPDWKERSELYALFQDYEAAKERRIR